MGKTVNGKQWQKKKGKQGKHACNEQENLHNNSNCTRFRY